MRAKSKLPAAAETLPQASQLRAGGALSEFELTLTVLWNNFSQWVERSAGSSGIKGLSSLDILVLHFMIYRSGPLRAVDIAFALSIENIHLVSYAAKKLVRLGLVKSERKGKEILYTPTEKGEPVYQRHLAMRQEYLISAIETVSRPGCDLETLTSMLRTFSGIYDQAARSVVVHEVFALERKADGEL